MTIKSGSLKQELAARSCVACRRGEPAMTPDAVAQLLPAVPEWALAEDGPRIVRRFVRRNFADAFTLVARIAAIAEAADHHPDLGLGWGYVTASLQTHAIQGLHLNDFIVAARIDQVVDREIGDQARIFVDS